MYKIKLNTKNGFSVVEALISCAIFGIGFVAFLALSSYGIDLTQKHLERTKSSLLTNMILEDLIIDQENVPNYNNFTINNNNLSEVSGISNKNKVKWANIINTKRALPINTDIRKVTVSTYEDETGNKKNRVIIKIESLNKKVTVLTGKVFNYVE